MLQTVILTCVRAVTYFIILYEILGGHLPHPPPHKRRPISAWLELYLTPENIALKRT